ncbi:hypothetical protein ACNS7O_17020 (plasmid) [Haloferacaceae archaeon DSL9]
MPRTAALSELVTSFLRPETTREVAATMPATETEAWGRPAVGLPQRPLSIRDLSTLTERTGATVLVRSKPAARSTAVGEESDDEITEFWLVRGHEYLRYQYGREVSAHADTAERRWRRGEEWLDSREPRTAERIGDVRETWHAVE